MISCDWFREGPDLTGIEIEGFPGKTECPAVQPYLHVLPDRHGCHDRSPVIWVSIMVTIHCGLARSVYITRESEASNVVPLAHESKPIS